MSPRGFTLIELLVVIAIIAILAAVVVLVLNPADLLRQARDSNRIHDLSTLRTAVALFLTDVKNPQLVPDYTKCYVSTTSTVGAQCGVFTNVAFTNNYSSSRAVDGTGWLPVNFTALSANSPIGSTLPRDPLNNSTYYYAYAASGTARTYEVNANMESTKYSASGTRDIESIDGGDQPNEYEVGSNPGLNL